MPSEAHRSPEGAVRKILLYATLALSGGIAAASLTLITPSLPSLQSELGISMSQLGASQAVYLLCIAVPQLLYGSYSDRVGRRKPLLVGLAIFVAGSVGATFAFDIWSLMLARLLQAVGASAGMVISRGIVRDMHPEERMASVMGFLAMPMMVMPMIAPALGGFVQDMVGWRGNFWLLAGSGVALLAAALAWLPRDRRPAAAADAPSGAARRILGSGRFHFFALQFGLNSAMNQLFFIMAPFVMERQFGQAPSAYGVWLSVPPMMYFVGNFLSGLYAARHGTIRMVRAGTFAMALACGLWVAVFALFDVASVELFLVMGCIALCHGIVMPSAAAGSTGAIATAFGLASGIAGFMQAALGAAVVLAATIAGIETATMLVWWMAGISLICLVISQLLLPGDAASLPPS